MSWVKQWVQALKKIVRAVDSSPAARPPLDSSRQKVAASHAREMLERMRRGEYEFSGTEISEILKKNSWLGCHQARFESFAASGDSLVEVRLKVPMLGKVSIILLITDLWHDHRVSSIDFQIHGLHVKKWRDSHIKRILENVVIGCACAILRWKGAWRIASLRFVLRADRTIRLYVEWPEKRSTLLGNISVIGVRIQQNSVVFYTFRRSAELQRGIGIPLSNRYEESQTTAMGKVAVVFSWLLLGAYAFVLVHVTLPVLGGAFKLMPQGATAFHIWILTQTYNLCVILLSYFFLRITMLPFYLKWNKSKEDLQTLISLEERDHQYLQPLTAMARKMQQAGQAFAKRESTIAINSVTSESIAHMIELMSTIREQSRQRLLGMSRMRRGWVQDLLIGYIFIFSLEWMYYHGLLTPLSVSIKWVNRIMIGLFLTD